MKFDYIRIYEKNEIDNRFDKKYRIAFVKNKDKYTDEIKDVIYSKDDNVKLYYPQNYKEFLHLLKHTKVIDGKIIVYDISRGCLLANDYKNKNYCWHQTKSNVDELINFAREYYIDKHLPTEQQEIQTILFVNKSKEIIQSKSQEVCK